MTLDCWRWVLSPLNLGKLEYSFIAINPRSTLTQSGNTYLGPIYGSNRNIQSLSILGTIELYVNEWIELLVLNWYTWNHLYVNEIINAW